MSNNLLICWFSCLRQWVLQVGTALPHVVFLLAELYSLLTDVKEAERRLALFTKQFLMRLDFKRGSGSAVRLAKTQTHWFQVF